MGIAARLLRVESDAFHQIGHAFPDFRFWYFHVVADGFGDDLAHTHPRIEGRKRVLENYLKRGARVSEFFAIQRKQIFSIEIHPAGGRLDETQNRTTYGGFAAPAFPDQAQGLPPI